jgi:hypothetical protein
MKTNVKFILVLVFALALAACGNPKTNANKDTGEKRQPCTRYVEYHRPLKKSPKGAFLTTSRFKNGSLTYIFTESLKDGAGYDREISRADAVVYDNTEDGQAWVDYILYTNEVGENCSYEGQPETMGSPTNNVFSKSAWYEIHVPAGTIQTEPSYFEETPAPLH